MSKTSEARRQARRSRKASEGSKGKKATEKCDGTFLLAQPALFNGRAQSWLQSFSQAKGFTANWFNLSERCAGLGRYLGSVLGWPVVLCFICVTRSTMMTNSFYHDATPEMMIVMFHHAFYFSCIELFWDFFRSGRVRYDVLGLDLFELPCFALNLLLWPRVSPGFRGGPCVCVFGLFVDGDSHPVAVLTFASPVSPAHRASLQFNSVVQSFVFLFLRWILHDLWPGHLDQQASGGQKKGSFAQRHRPISISIYSFSVVIIYNKIFDRVTWSKKWNLKTGLKLNGCGQRTEASCLLTWPASTSYLVTKLQLVT